MEVLRKIDEQICTSDNAICRHIESLEFFDRGAVSQDILKKLRDFVEHTMFKIYATSNSNAVSYDYKNIEAAIKFVKTKGQLKFLWKFHSYLQIVASHYTLDLENSERVMLKYYEYLLKTKQLLKDDYGFDVLRNIDKFPLNTDKNMQKYYEKIVEKLASKNQYKDLNSSIAERYYIHKSKPFFVNQRIYYEITFAPATSKASKFDRIIAFTEQEISKNYAVKLRMIEDNIQILGKVMLIFIVVKWEVAIRPVEIEKFSVIFGERLQGYTSSAEGRGLMHFLTQTGFNLVELLCFEDIYYEQAKMQIHAAFNAKVSHLFDIFDRCRHIIKNSRSGHNVLRYLLFHMNNTIIGHQIGDANKLLSGLHLDYGCLPFEQMPFDSALKNHNPRLSDLFECIDADNRAHEVLGRHIHNNAEISGRLYVPMEELERFGDITTLIRTFNNEIYHKHKGRKIKERSKHLYIHSYEEDTIAIIQKLIQYSCKGIKNHKSYVDSWLTSGVYQVDCEEKKNILLEMFVQSSVAMIYGSAGTGKSTLINHISNLFKEQSKLYLANTNPAVDNMKRRVTIQTNDTDFMTITKFMRKQKNRVKYDIVIIDECSTVGNRDMKAILEKAEFNLLVLVGDIYQIESIRFGNWFSTAREFLPNASVYELSAPYRSHNQELQVLWDRVRSMDDKILESIVRQSYSVTLDATIFESSETDEVILCLNYDGLYGINNINRLLQGENPSKAVSWGLLLYKVGDPILFNESDRFSPLIYNNIKGRIIAVEIIKDQIQFDIEVDKPINGLDAHKHDFELLSNSVSGHSIIRFTVDDYRKIDENHEIPITAIVPFQVAYAVSIHKAQGLEYSSVKIVITDEIEERITHSVFYTAITRARNKLKIYWTPEVEKRVLGRIMPRNNNRDVNLLKQAMSSM